MPMIKQGRYDNRGEGMEETKYLVSPEDVQLNTDEIALVPQSQCATKTNLPIPSRV